MKVNASLLSRYAKSPRETVHAQKLASRLEPGQSIEFVDGSLVRVLQKSASPSGMRFVVAGAGGRQSMSLRQIAALGPVTPAMRRLASFVHHILAFDRNIDTYVKEAIKAAGYPVDPSMDWAKYLDKMYRPLLIQITSDEGLQDDAIRDTVIDQLFSKKSLKNFDPKRQAEGKAIDKMVTAFLINLFGHRKEDVATYARRAMGIGAKGEVGLQAAPSLDAPLNADKATGVETTFGDTFADEKSYSVETMEGEEEVRAFMSAFREYLGAQTFQPYTRKTLDYITEAFSTGDDKSEIREHIIDNPDFQSRFGEPLNLNAYNFAMGQWVRFLRAFANDPEWGWNESPIARMLIRLAEKLADGGKTEKAKKPRAASLKLADFEPELEQPQQPNVAANVAPPPPPVNPNVMQQNAIKPSMTNLNTAQPANDPAAVAQDAQDPNQQKRTIPPEIPGVNHTASAEEETDMPVETKEASSKRAQVSERLKQRRVARKFATLRRVAEQEPSEVGAAITQLASYFTSLATKLGNLNDHLDMAAELPKEASIRQKVAHRNLFARGLKQLASEEPQELEQALNDFYTELNGAVTDFENLADNLGLKLDAPAEPSDDDEFFEGPLSEATEQAAEEAEDEPREETKESENPFADA